MMPDARTIGAVAGALLLGVATVGVLYPGDVPPAQALTVEQAAAWDELTDRILPAVEGYRSALGEVATLQDERTRLHTRLEEIQVRLQDLGGRAEEARLVARAACRRARELREILPESLRDSGQALAAEREP